MSDVQTKSGKFKVESDLDENIRKKEGWIKDSEFHVRDYTRHISPEEGASLGRYKEVEHYLAWSTSNEDAMTSKEELLEKMNLVHFLAGEDMPKELKKYEKKVGRLKEHRKMWIGPRNELRNTKVSVEVTFADNGLDRLVGKTEEEIWAALGRATKGLKGDEPAPAFLDPAARQALAAGTTTNVVDKTQYQYAKKFVDQLLIAASEPDEEKRNDLVREALASRPKEEVAIGALVELLGRDAVRYDLKVDSAAGRKGKTYDFKLSHKGDEFRLQKTVFGENL